MNNFSDIRRQAGAITYRVADGHAQILLVTSLDTRRWIIPKGNIEKGSTPAQAAACEVAEEAGIEGEIIGTTPLGLYNYLKRLKSGEGQPTTVEVYLLRTIRQLFDWPEKGRRDLLWLPVMEAIERIQEPGVVPLLDRVGQLERALRLFGQPMAPIE